MAPRLLQVKVGKPSMKKILLSLALVCIVVATVVLVVNRLEGDSITQSAPTLDSLAQAPDRSVATLAIQGVPLSVEVVNTPASITKGLSGRTEIGQDGMLFVLGRREMASFWMIDMLFDLDLIWIDGNTIVNITSNVPAPAATVAAQSLPTYPSGVLVTHVLEVPAGTAQAGGWHTGDFVELLP